MILQLLASRLIPHWFDKTRSKRILLFGTKAKPSIIVLFFVDLYRRSSLLLFFSIYFLFSLSFSFSQCPSVPLHTNIIDITNTFFFLYIYKFLRFQRYILDSYTSWRIIIPISFCIQEENIQQYRKARDPDSAEPFSPIPDIVLLDDKRTDFGRSFFSLTFSISPPLHRSRVAPFPSSLVRRELYPDLSANDR